MRKLHSTVRDTLLPALVVSLVQMLSTYHAFSSPGNAQSDSLTHPLPVTVGWNLLSLPVGVTGGTKGVIFPTAVSGAFGFDSAYTAIDTLEHGRGFWLKFASAQTIAVPGTGRFSDTITLRAGWNIIGTLSTPVAVSAISTVPAGIVTSHFFGFSPPPLGYRSTDTLEPGRGYWVKASQAGSIILRSMNVSCPWGPTVAYAGATYRTVQILDQCWLKENLDVGEMIFGADTGSDNGTIEKYCYDNDPANCAVYGGLYQWNEAMQYLATDSAQGICPPGWRLPTKAEYQALASAVDNDGNALKAEGQGTGGGAGTNSSGFSGLLAGGRGLYPPDYFGELHYLTRIWSSTGLDSTSKYCLDLGFQFNNINLYSTLRDLGISVRCLRGGGPEGADPMEPSGPDPADHATNQPPDLVVGWTCSDPDSDTLAYDIYFGTDDPPVTIVSSRQSGTTLSRTGLDPLTRYYWRVVARDDRGNMTGGPVWTFATVSVPCPGTPTVDHGGKRYNTVQIGAQCWLKENLDIGAMLSGSAEASDNDTIEKYCYDDDTANCAVYGGLYQWNEAMQYSTTPGVRGICPPGWRIPSHADHGALKSFVEDDGNALKAAGQGTGAGAGTNASGFSALLAGGRSREGFFYGQWGFFWSSTESDTPYAGRMSLPPDTGTIGLHFDDRNYGHSIRCLKNDGAPPHIPSYHSPADDDSAVFTSAAFTWSCDDPDGDPLTYELYIGTEDPPETKEYSNVSATSQHHSGLSINTTYYWSVVANDGHGNLSAGPVWSFSTGGPYGLPCPGTAAIDYGGKTYNTVLIGDQCWLKENLDAGTMIARSVDASNNDTIEKYCYDDDTANCALYGGLYQWNEAMQYDSIPARESICPPGWHLPTRTEFATLSSAVGGDGNALKATGQGTGNGAGTNTSGFSAMMSGLRTASYYFGLGTTANSWSSTEVDASATYDLRLPGDAGSFVVFDSYPKAFGFSVRCLMN